MNTNVVLQWSSPIGPRVVAPVGSTVAEIGAVLPCGWQADLSAQHVASGGRVAYLIEPTGTRWDSQARAYVGNGFRFVLNARGEWVKRNSFTRPRRAWAVSS